MPSPRDPMMVVLIRLTPFQAQELDAEGVRRCTSRAELIRRIIDDWIDSPSRLDTLERRIELLENRLAHRKIPARNAPAPAPVPAPIPPSPPSE